MSKTVKQLNPVTMRIEEVPERLARGALRVEAPEYVTGSGVRLAGILHNQAGYYTEIVFPPSSDSGDPLAGDDLGKFSGAVFNLMTCLDGRGTLEFVAGWHSSYLDCHVLGFALRNGRWEVRRVTRFNWEENRHECELLVTAKSLRAALYATWRRLDRRRGS